MGDEAFAKKSFERMEELMSGGTAVLLVSHQMKKVETLSDRVIWLDRGEIRMVGEPMAVIQAYKASVG